MRLLICTLCVFLLAGLAIAALPPLSNEELKEAPLIVTGTIIEVTYKDVKRSEQFVDRFYDVTVRVQTIEKGLAAKLGEDIVVSMWQPQERPNGWAGPQGQNVTPEKGARVRGYISVDANNSMSFLSPNGLDELEAPSTAPATAPTTQP